MSRLRQIGLPAAWAGRLGCIHAADSLAQAAEPIDGFLAPHRSVDVATAETGILRRIVHREGTAVEAGQVLAQLDDEVHAAVMAEAERSMRSAGRREAAYAEQQLRRERLEALEDLLPRGSARPEEVNRARADLEIATAQLPPSKTSSKSDNSNTSEPSSSGNAARSMRPATVLWSACSKKKGSSSVLTTRS